MAEEAFEQIVETLARTHEAVEAGKCFGVRCIQTNGKVFAALHHGAMVFKLAGATHAEALALPGAALWDPSGAGQPFRAWVAVPAAQAAHWDELAEAAVTGMEGHR